MEPSEKIIDKLQKLIAHKESAELIGSLKEAQAFSEKITALLIEYKLDMSKVTKAEDNSDDLEIAYAQIDLASFGIPKTSRRSEWMETLGATVAKANFCKIMVQQKSNCIYFIGTKMDRQVAEYTYANLVRSAIEMGEREYRIHYYEFKKIGATEEMGGFKKAFFKGFNVAIFDRLSAQRAQADSTQSTALVLANAETRVAQFMRGMRTRPAGRVGGRSQQANESGYAAGKAHGTNVNMNKGVNGGGNSPSVTAGQKRLG